MGFELDVIEVSSISLVSSVSLVTNMDTLDTISTSISPEVSPDHTGQHLLTISIAPDSHNPRIIPHCTESMDASCSQLISKCPLLKDLLCRPPHSTVSVTLTIAWCINGVGYVI
jgi:hypothetical protein